MDSSSPSVLPFRAGTGLSGLPAAQRLTGSLGNERLVQGLSPCGWQGCPCSEEFKQRLFSVPSKEISSCVSCLEDELKQNVQKLGD